jgi:hypothetical protein
MTHQRPSRLIAPAFASCNASERASFILRDPQAKRRSLKLPSMRGVCHDRPQSIVHHNVSHDGIMNSHVP